MKRIFNRLRGKKKTKWGRCPKCDSILVVEKSNTSLSDEQRDCLTDEKCRSDPSKHDLTKSITFKEIKLLTTEPHVVQDYVCNQATPAKQSPSEQDTLFDLSITSEIASSSCQVELMALPIEILFRIVKYVPHDDTLAALKCTCSFFKSMLEDDRVWNRTTLNIQVDVHWGVVDRVLISSPYLTSINLSDCMAVTDHLITAVITVHKELRYVNVSGCVLISDMSLTQLQLHVTALEHLDISRCCLITCGGVFSLLRKHSKTLQYLDMSECLGMAYDPYRVSRMAKFSSNLKHLSFGWCKTAVGLNPILDTDVVKFATMCPNLSSLDVSCSNLNSYGIDAIAKNCQQLHDLALSHSCIKDLGVTTIANSLHLLQKLDLSDCSYITDKALQSISTMLQSLQLLDVSRCFNITDAGLALLLNKLICLRELQLAGCFRITDKSLEDDTLLCKMLCYINMSSTMVSAWGVERLKERASPCLHVVVEGCPLVQYTNLANDVLLDSTQGWPPCLIETPRQWMTL